MVFRHFGAPDARDAAFRLREATSAAGGLLLIGLDADLAAAVEADGVHLPERALHLAGGLREARPDWLLTGAIHGATGLPDDEALGAIILSPVFPAGGASSDKAVLGLEEFNRLVAAAPCPAWALGGVNASNARDLIGSGACGIAGVSAIRAAFGPN